jgi:hypothetical protein
MIQGFTDHETAMLTQAVGRPGAKILVRFNFSLFRLGACRTRSHGRAEVKFLFSPTDEVTPATE